MGLIKEKTNLVTRIAGAVGVVIPGKSGKKSLTSPKISKQKTKIMKKRTNI